MKVAVSKDGTKLAYDTYGNGPALIYITGASCFRNFIPVASDAKAFSDKFTVYTYDRRGRGDSGNTLPYSIQREIEDIEALVDAAGGKAYLYGHSSGAVLALEAAMHIQGKIQRVAIYDASYVHDEIEKKKYKQLSKTIKGLLDRGENASAMKTFLAEIGMPKFFVKLLPLFPGWKTMKALAPTLMYDIALTADLPPIKRLANITIPIQIMVGGKSPASLSEVASQITQAIPGATLIRLESQDHMVSSKVLMPFLSKFLK